MKRAASPLFRRRRRLAASLALGAIAAGVLAAAPGPAGVDPGSADGFARGEVVDPVTALADPAETYALYLPSTYTPARRWPMLLVLDARGRGRLAAERFRAGAESYGWIVASANNSASDGPWEPNQRAVEALLGEAEHRFAVDLRRLYVAGFSGTARGAWAVGLGLPHAVAGVIACSGGSPGGAPPAAGLPFAVFAAAGSEDFNFLEVRELGERLAALGLPFRVATFPGRHAWPPAEVCTEAMAWMELQAMKAGRAATDRALIDRLFDRWLGEARKLEAAGAAPAAQRRFAEVARDFDGLRDVGEPRAAADRLAGSAAVVAARAEEERAAAWERARRREVEEMVAALQAPAPAPGVRPRAVALIRSLEGAAAPADAAASPRQLAARRVLEYLASALAFYLPRDLLGRGEYARAITPLELAVEIRDDDPLVWYNLACAHARAGSRKRALEALDRAIARGFADRAKIDGDQDLDSLRGDERFWKIVARLGVERRP